MIFHDRKYEPLRYARLADAEGRVGTVSVPEITLIHKHIPGLETRPNWEWATSMGIPNKDHQKNWCNLAFSIGFSDQFAQIISSVQHMTYSWI